MTQNPTQSSKQARCAALNAAGQPCGAGVPADAVFCFLHDPERQAAAAEARRKGGENRNKPVPPAAPVDLSTVEARRRAIEDTINRLRSGQETNTVARSVVYAISVAHAISTHEEILQRLAALEAALVGQQEPREAWRASIVSAYTPMLEDIGGDDASR